MNVVNDIDWKNCFIEPRVILNKQMMKQRAYVKLCSLSSELTTGLCQQYIIYVKEIRMAQKAKWAILCQLDLDK